MKRTGKTRLGYIDKDIADKLASFAIKDERTEMTVVNRALKRLFENDRPQATVDFLRRSLYDIIEKEESDQMGVVHWIKSRFGITTSSQWAKNTLAMADDIANGTEPKCEEVARAFKKS